jgi:hypothetical protein
MMSLAKSGGKVESSSLWPPEAEVHLEPSRRQLEI